LVLGALLVGSCMLAETGTAPLSTDGAGGGTAGTGGTGTGGNTAGTGGTGTGSTTAGTGGTGTGGNTAGTGGAGSTVITPTCPFASQWSDVDGDSAVQTAYDVAVDDAGSSVIVGKFKGTLDFGGSCEALVKPSGGGAKHHIFVAKLDASGNCAWAKAYGNAAKDQPKHDVSVTVDSAGNALVAGDISGSQAHSGLDIDFGGSCGPVSTVNNDKYDIFIAKLDGSTGDCQWVYTAGNGDQDQRVGALAVDSTDKVLIAGAIRGSQTGGGVDIDFGGDCGLVSTVDDSKRDIFVAKIDGGGAECKWVYSSGEGTQNQEGLGLAVDTHDNALVTGGCRGAGMGCTANKTDVFVAKIDEGGGQLWAHALGDGTNDQSGEAVAVNSANDVLITGACVGSLDLSSIGGTTLACDGGKKDVFLIALTSGGGHAWSASYGAAAEDAGLSVAADAADHVVVTGLCQASVNFGGDSICTTAQAHVFLAKYDSAGNHLCSRAFGALGQDQQTSAVAVHPTIGDMVLAGACRGDVSFGGGQHTCDSVNDVFAARFDP